MDLGTLRGDSSTGYGINQTGAVFPGSPIPPGILAGTRVPLLETRRSTTFETLGGIG